MKLHDEYETLVVFALNTTETWSNTPRSVQIHQGAYIQLWMRYVPEIFCRYSWDVSALVLNNSEFLVYL